MAIALTLLFAACNEPDALLNDLQERVEDLELSLRPFRDKVDRILQLEVLLRFGNPTAECESKIAECVYEVAAVRGELEDLRRSARSSGGGERRAQHGSRCVRARR